MTQLVFAVAAFSLLALTIGQPLVIGAAPLPPQPGEPLLMQGPHLEAYTNSGCLGRAWDDMEPCPDDDQFSFTVSGATLHVLHASATYNCCPDDIVVSFSLEGSCIQLTETEILAFPCDCNCCYEVEAVVAGLLPGGYTIEFCWFDYETWSPQSHWAEIVVPTAGRPQGKAEMGAASSALDRPARSAEPWVPPVTDRVPRVSEYANSGCLLEYEWACEEDDEVVFTVTGTTLYVQHSNATYNCCLDDIAVSMTLEGDIIHLVEEEIVSQPCYCICCFDVAATIVDLPAGTYTAEFCWFDYEIWQPRCYVEEIVIP